MATNPSLIANSPSENCCWLEGGGADGDGAAEAFGAAEEVGAAVGVCWPIEAKFHTPCAFLISSTLGRSRASESICTDLLSSGSSLTETLSSWVWTNAR